MDDYQIRQQIKTYVERKIHEFIKNYLYKYKDNIGFLLWYHLIALEKEFINSYPSQGKVEIYRSSISWFIGQIKPRIGDEKLDFRFNQGEFDYYCENILPVINNAYSDYKVLKEIMDMSSFTKSQLLELSPSVYKLINSTVWGGFLKEYLYFNGVHDKERMEYERTVKKQPLEFLSDRIKNSREKNLKGDINKIERLMIDVNKDLLELCYQSTELDLSKIEGFKSETIRSDKSLLDLISVFYYFSQVRLETYKLSLLDSPNDQALLITFDKEYLVQKINKITDLNVEFIKKCITYFSFDGRGTLLEFPILEYNGRVHFIPSSFLLSDLQFSLTNGHYLKNTKVIRRDNSVSKSVVSEITSSLGGYNNIVVVEGKYYEFTNDVGKKENSDIDVAIYDRNSNSLLIIECKWKENHYISVLEENNVKILDTLNKAYSKQLNKHKAFLESDLDNINSILELTGENELRGFPQIFYIAVDKRCQLYIDNKYLVPLYGLLTLFKIHGDSQSLKLEIVIEELKKQNTKVDYVYIDENQKEVDIDSHFTLYTDDLNLDYDIDK
ncbi:hypothetical protein [Paenibacillus sp. Y412MC10]|uniref:hypothetical protein n=1 Tax=Geobacillus sp. (strain Y412MC10) TaxID=481743 RepID=UPI0011AB4CE0|nr:hypothetical protein [Paenibacillus sp. Y412MC10]